jgi:hypothetical protein
LSGTLGRRAPVLDCVSLPRSLSLAEPLRALRILVSKAGVEITKRCQLVRDLVAKAKLLSTHTIELRPQTSGSQSAELECPLSFSVAAPADATSGGASGRRSGFVSVLPWGIARFSRRSRLDRRGRGAARGCGSEPSFDAQVLGEAAESRRRQPDGLTCTLLHGFFASWCLRAERQGAEQ